MTKLCGSVSGSPAAAAQRTLPLCLSPSLCSRAIATVTDRTVLLHHMVCRFRAQQVDDFVYTVDCVAFGYSV